MENTKELIAALARDADACERSWSLTATETEERALFFFDASTDAAQKLAEAAVQLGLGKSLLEEWSKVLPGADAIGLALRRDRRSVRLYTQYWTQLVARAEAGDSRPYPLYRGFKALPDGSSRRDDYLCFPALARDGFWPPMAQAFAAHGLCVDSAAEVFADLQAESAIFTATEGAGRRSWLTTVRRAKIDRAALARWLAPLAARPGAAAIIDAAQTSDLVHVAGGEDSVKGDFLTFYFESDPETVIARLR